MSDLQLLFIVLLGLYGWECICWLPRGTLAVKTWFGKKWLLATPSSLVGNSRGGVVFANPIPPLGTILVSGPLPLSISPEGIWGRTVAGGDTAWRPSQLGGWVPFTDLRNLQVSHKRVLAGAQTVLRAPSATWAVRISQLLEEWRDLVPEKRNQAVREFIRMSLDSKRVEQRWNEFKAATTLLRWFTNVLVGYLFLLAPLVIWRFGLRQTWPVLLAGLFGLTLATALEYRKRHRQFYPDASEERFTHCLTILLSPANAARALDLLSRPLLEAFHPLSVAQRFCSEVEFRRMASEYWRDLNYPAANGLQADDSPALQAERLTRESTRSEVEVFLAKNGIRTADLLSTPAINDPTCRAYCPRCQAQFVTMETPCVDCGGVKLLPLPVSPHTKVP